MDSERGSDWKGLVPKKALILGAPPHPHAPSRSLKKEQAQFLGPGNHHPTAAGSLTRQILPTCLTWSLAAVLATTVMTGVVLAFTLYNQVNRYAAQVERVQFDLLLLKSKQAQLEAIMAISDTTKVSKGQELRSRRQVERANNILGADGSPASDPYKNTEGLRIYDTWFQDEQSIPYTGPAAAQGLDQPIRPHHRTSAAWVEKQVKPGHNLNPHFDENQVYKSPYPAGTRRPQGLAIDLPNRNRAKETARLRENHFLTKSKPPTTTTASPSSSLFLENDLNESSLGQGHANQENQLYHQQKKHQFLNAMKQPLHEESSSSNGTTFPGLLVRSLPSLYDGGPNHQAPSRGGGGLASVHYVGKASTPNADGSEANRAQDGVFRVWDAARWAKKLRAEEGHFQLDRASGFVKVEEAGVYLVYAQVNYLDAHDVNAFQVLVNSDPFLLCTTMTHTGSFPEANKVNTCYTAGATFLEAGDTVAVKDMETNRHSVVRPSHTFFGLVQLSRL